MKGAGNMTPFTPKKFGKLSKLILILSIAWGGILPQFPSPFILAAETGFLLSPLREAGQRSTIEIELEVGGDLLVHDESKPDLNLGKGFQVNTQEKKLPLNLTGTLHYQEHLLDWSEGHKARSIRNYDMGKTTIEVDSSSQERVLPKSQRLILAEVRDAKVVLNGLYEPLTRDLADLLHVVGDSLVLDRLLPERRLTEGESWKHDKQTIGALLGMDHVALCEVESVVTEEEQGKVRLRLAGTVHGTIDGSATELDLRGNYLFDPTLKRISRFNMAIQEKRKMGVVTPGLDVVANLQIKVLPTEAESSLNEKVLSEAEKLVGPINPDLVYSSPSHGVRFHHNDHWFITAESRGQLALRHLKGSSLVAHCNITTLPARAAGRQTTLEQFEADIRQALGDRLDEVSAAKQWTTTQGHHCLGIFINGKTEGIPLQWRYYLIATDDLPRISMAVTLEQAQLEAFADADRQLIETLQLTGQSPSAKESPSENASSQKTASIPDKPHR